MEKTVLCFEKKIFKMEKMKVEKNITEIVKKIMKF